MMWVGNTDATCDTSMKLMANVTNSIVLVSEGGKRYVYVEAIDSLEVFFELMEVVEALCPVWPERKPIVGHIFRL